MKYLLPLFIIISFALQSFGQSQQLIGDLKRNYKNVQVNGEFIHAVDKKSKEKCIFLLDGTMLYKYDSSGFLYAKKDKIYGGVQHYIITAVDGKGRALVDQNGKTIITYPQRVTFIENKHSKVFMHETYSGPQRDSYSNTEVILPDGTLLFKSHGDESLKAVYDNENLFFIGKHISGNLIFCRLLDSNGNELITGSDAIYDYKLGGKYYFTSYGRIPESKSFKKYPLVFDDSGNMLGLETKNWYIELDGEVFFILQKYSKGFNDKIEKGAVFVYSPDYGELMSWGDNDKALALRNENGKKMLVKTSESGAEEKVALSDALFAQNAASTPRQQTAKPSSPKAGENTKSVAKPSRNEIDADIPKSDAAHPNTFALIIANENYRREEQVPYALNDGQIFAEYLKNTLGVPEKNIQLYTDASLNDIKYGINRLSQISEAFGADASVIVYYAGHGIPDEKSLDAHLLPVDGYGSDPSTGYSLNALYDALSNLQVKQTVLLLDACFSGSQRSGKMMASNSRGVRLKPKAAEVSGNLIVISATQGDETAYPYEGQEHGMFTYFLLKNLNENKGKVTIGELSDYLITNVKRASVLNNEKMQTPSVKVSPALSSSWRDISFGE